MSHDIKPLIHSYLAKAEEAMADMREGFPALANVKDRRSLGIPQEGILPSGRTFSFHGIGCRFELADNVVDMDFGPNGETNGFDAWRIMVCQRRRVAELGLELADIRSAVSEMHENGELVRLPDWPLYFLPKS